MDKESAQKRLLELSDQEVRTAIETLTLHVKARMRFGSMIDRTKYGAHSKEQLGIDAIDYYVGEAVAKLFDPNGWIWKYDKRTLAEQLCRIANKLISDKLNIYESNKENCPRKDDREISDIKELEDLAERDILGNEERYSHLVKLAISVSEDNEDLHYFTLRYFDGADYSVIASEMSLSIEKIYNLRKKLVRRLLEYKDELSPEESL